MVNIKRIKQACHDKVSFTNLDIAVRYAEKHSQRVYECPICHCWHCTSKPDWSEDFVSQEKHKEVITQHKHIITTLEAQLGKEKRKSERRVATILKQHQAIKQLKQQIRAERNKNNSSGRAEK